MDSSAVQLVFAGEVLDGFTLADVKQRLAQRLKLDEARLRSLFSGQRVVLKRGLSADTAAHWVAQFREMGAQLHVVRAPADAEPAVKPPAAPAPVTPVAPAPLTLAPLAPPPPPRDPYAAPAPPPIAVNTPPVTEEITCPSCGERQPKRILCRNCACDMPRGIAAREEEAAAERARRNEEMLARRGGRRGAATTAPPRTTATRTARIGPSEDDAPLFGLSFEGRIGRMRNFLGGLLAITTIVWLVILTALAPSGFTGTLLVLGLAFVMVWGIRLTVLRLHDVNRSGWWVLVLFVPYLGNLASLVLALWPGDEDDNEHGAPPTQGGSLPAIAVLVVLCLSLAAGWQMAWSAIQHQIAQIEEEAGEDEGDAPFAEEQLPPASELLRALRSDAAAGEFPRYMATPGHRAFAVSSAGAWGWHGGAARPDQAIDSALADCERRRSPYTPNCRVVHVNDQWAMD